MKKYLWFLALPIMVAGNAAYAEDAADENANEYGWRANLNKASLEVSSTKVKNAREYKDSPNSKLSSDSETVTKGVLDFYLDYNQEKYLWSNNLFAEYGKTKIKPVDGPDVTSENADKILLSTDYARKIWRYLDADVGPFIKGEYQTEFDKNEDAPRTRIARGLTGVKMFEGQYIKDMYAAAFGEYDFTYSKDVSKYGYELGLRAEYPFREGVKFDVDTYFRDYLGYSSYNAKDFKYEWNLTARMMVDIYKNFSFGPYVQYLQAKDRGSHKYGSSTIIGVAVDYSGLWDL